MSEFCLTVMKGRRRYTFRAQRYGFEASWFNGRLTLTLLNSDGPDNSAMDGVFEDAEDIDRIDIVYERDEND